MGVVARLAISAAARRSSSPDGAPTPSVVTSTTSGLETTWYAPMSGRRSKRETGLVGRRHRDARDRAAAGANGFAVAFESHRPVGPPKSPSAVRPSPRESAQKMFVLPVSPPEPPGPIKSYEPETGTP